MAKASEDVDFDFFDSPRTTSRNERNLEKNAVRPGKSDTSSRDDVSESTVTSAKPPTHPNSATKKSRHRDESSDSEGRDSPRSNTSISTTQSKRTIEAKIPSVGLHHDTDDDDYDDKNDEESGDDKSASHSNDSRTYSSSKDERSSTRSATPNGNERNIKHANIGRKKSSGISSRGSVSLKEDSKDKNKDGKKEKNKKKSAYLSDNSDGSDTDITDTDSDVTDVSPLSSPHNPPDLLRQKSAKPRPVRNVSTTLNRSSTLNIDHILSAHKDTVDLKVLLQTVLEMENEGSVPRSRQFTSGVGAPSGDFCRQRKNYSFTNEQVMKIDRENQRLLENIMRKAREAKKAKQELKMVAKKQTSTTPLRPTSSAVNRIRQQQKIEAENLGILRRLQQTRPTKELQRDVLIDDYKKHLVFAGSAPVSSVQPRARSSFLRYADGSMAEPSTAFGGSTAGDTIRRPRPQSAFVKRPQSGKRMASTATHRRPRSASLKKKEGAKDLLKKDDKYSDDFEVESLS